MPDRIAMAKTALLFTETSQPGTEQAIGRSAPQMLHSVGLVPMVPEREFV